MVQKHPNPIVQNHISNLCYLVYCTHFFYILIAVLTISPNQDGYIYIITVLLTYNIYTILIYVYQTRIKKNKCKFIIIKTLLFLEFLFTIIDITLNNHTKSIFNINVTILYETLVLQILLYTFIHINLKGIRLFQYGIDIEDTEQQLI